MKISNNWSFYLKWFHLWCITSKYIFHKKFLKTEGNGTMWQRLIDHNNTKRLLELRKNSILVIGYEKYLNLESMSLWKAHIVDLKKTIKYFLAMIKRLYLKQVVKERIIALIKINGWLNIWFNISLHSNNNISAWLFCITCYCRMNILVYKTNSRMLSMTHINELGDLKNL